MTIIDIIKIIFLWPFSLIYWLATELRAGAYKTGLFRSQKVYVPVISIGNIAAGGTGKTPMAIYLAQILLDKGMKVAVLSRGYKRKSKTKDQKSKSLVVSDGLNVLCPVDEAGDEPFLMATRLLGTAEKPGAMVIVGRDRVAGAEQAIELGAEVVILDDGFQHLRLKRDLDIVLLDSQRPYGNGWLLPVGMLRESSGAMLRAGAIVFTRCKRENTKYEIRNSKAEIYEARHKTGQPYMFADRAIPDREALKNSRFVLFSGIARPESFEASVREAGIPYAGHMKYPDHHDYSPGQLKDIAEKAGECDYLLTTEKDAARLPAGADLGKPLLVLPVEMAFLTEEQGQRFDKTILDKVGMK